MLGFPSSYQGIIDSLKQAPDFTFRDAKLNVTAPMPLIISQDADYLVIVDTTGKTGPSALDSHQSGALFSADSYTRKEANKTTTYDYSAFRFLNFDKAGAVKWLTNARWPVYFSLIVLILVIFLFGKLLAALLLAAIFWLFARSGFGLTFGDSYKLTIYAMTLPALLGLALSRLSAFVLPAWLYALIVFFYLYRAGKAIKSEAPDVS